MSGIAFTSTTLQSYFNSNSSAANTFRTNADMKAAIMALDQRIAAMEVVLLPNSNADANDNFPYDKERLKREFLDEVLTLLLSAPGETNATNLGDTVHAADYSVQYSITFKLTGVNAGTSQSTASVREILESIGSTAYRPLTTDDIKNYIKKMASADTSDTALATATVTRIGPSSSGPHTIVSTDGIAILAAGGTNIPFDQMTLEQKMLLLTANGRSIYEHYAGVGTTKGLIDLVFDEGMKMGNNPKELTTAGVPTANDVRAALITAISPRSLTINGVTKLFTHATTINGQTYLIEAGAQIYEVEKKILNNSAGTPTGFNLGFTEALSTTNRLYVPVNASTLEPITNGTVLNAPVRNLTIMEFLYFWNEARIKVLRGKLAYEETVTREVQEDLRQANEALAELENVASQTRAQDKDSGKPNPDSSEETLKLDLWEARASASGETLFNTKDGDDKHNYGEWAENRTNLKNYIDRKSAQAQESMLDYQTTLNRYNNAFEVMAKLQEKLDGVLKSQIRNVN